MSAVTTAARSARPSPALRLMWWAQHAVFAVLAVVGLARALPYAPYPVWLVAGTTVLVGAYAAGVVAARHRPARAVGWTWLLVLTTVWAALVTVSPAFAWVAFALFFLYLHLLPARPAVAAVVALTVAVVAALLVHGQGSPVAQVVGPAIGATVATVMAFIYRALVRESEERRQLINELVTAHDELARVQHEAGVLHERERLAREIHDTLTQGFSSIVLLTRAARAILADSDAAREPLDQAERTAAENLEEARRLVRALTPPALEGTPLTEALQRLTERLGEQAHVEARYLTEGAPYPLPTGHEVALLRVGQSALANVRLYAHARHAAVTLSYLPDAVTLDVVDDGAGFDPARVDTTAPAAGTGFGLPAMRARLADLGGTLTVESAPGEGTAVAATIPVTGGS